MPLSIGATKSASDRFGLSSAITSCWRSIGNRAAIFFGRPGSARRPQHDVVAVARSPARSRRRRGRESACRRRSASAASARARRDPSPPRRSSGSSRISGKRPFSSHAAKKNCQSMNGTSSSSATSTFLKPVNDGVAGLQSSRASSDSARACAIVRIGRSLRPACCSRSFAWAARLAASNAGLLLAAQQARDHVDHARRVGHVHGRLRVLRRDLHRRVLRARRRAADQQRQRHAGAAASPTRRTPSRRATA